MVGPGDDLLPSLRAERSVGAEEPEDVKLDALELKLLVVAETFQTSQTGRKDYRLQ